MKKLTSEERAYRTDVNRGLKLAKECLFGGGHIRKESDCFACTPSRMGELIVWLAEKQNMVKE